MSYPILEMPDVQAYEQFLSKETASQLKKETEDSASYYPISASGVTVGVCRSSELPSGVALPAGIELGTTALSAEVLLQAENTSPNLIAVRFRALLGVRPNDIDATVQTCQKARLVTIDGAVLGDGQKLSQIARKRGMSQTCEASLFTDGNARANLVGLYIANDDNTLNSIQQVSVNAIVYCGEDATREAVADLIATAVRRVLTTARDVAEDMSVCMAHYPLFGCGISATVVSAADEETGDESGETRSAWRRKTQEQFVLPLDRPFLRKSCRVYTAEASKNEVGDGGHPGRLADVHHGIKTHGLGDEGVAVHLVQNKYLYCHYMQDRFNDSGWGCAYRSLQTVLSWCAFERYAQFEKGVLPTHKDIQRALVDVGDKPPTFFGSKEWIGANEVCYALEKLTGVSSRILHVSRGSEMEGKGRELARHFDEQGSPVMVGGGVLAWTILGVARNEKTGKTKFLILDPHYEGRDELSTIQNKGWIAWKSADVFKADAFYNLCMPLRPSEV